MYNKDCFDREAIVQIAKKIKIWQYWKSFLFFEEW